MNRILWLIPLVVALLACSLTASGSDNSSTVAEVQPAIVMPSPSPSPTPEAPAVLSTAHNHANVAYSAQHRSVDTQGLRTLSEEILDRSTIVRATFRTAVSEVLFHQSKYHAAAKFTFRVSEYLKGSGGSTVTAYRVFGAPFDTTEEATAKAVAMLAERDTQWDQREAIVMLGTPHSDYAPSTIVGTNIYLLVWGDGYDLHDYYYSLHSKRARAWLPARYTPPDTSPGRGVAPEPSFLRSVPGGNATSTPATIGERNPGSTYESTTDNISLSDLKAKITTLMVEYNGGDGSAEYKECVRDKYRHKRHVRNWPTDEGHPYTPWNTQPTVGSGLPSAILSYLEGIDYEYTPPAPGTEYEPPVPAAYTFTGPNGGLFEIATTYTLGDYKNDGTIDRAYLKLNMQSTRPLPAGAYKFKLQERFSWYAICGFVVVNNFVVTVKALDGTLHEALFDPVTDGSAVAADSSSGQLKPAAFTDANEASATIQRIEWASDTVKVKVSPHTGLAGHKLDFIELDGAVSLSLQVDEATVDAANHALSWEVTPQPWDDGDLLMLRIAEVVPEVALVNVPATITQGQTASVTVRATDLSSSNSYTVRLAANSFAIGFNNSCLYGSKTVVVPSGSASHSATIPLQGCDATSSTVTATLMQGTSSVATATAEVEVEASSNVTVTLSPREERHGTYTNMTVQWNDPGGCVGRYYVGIFNSQQTVVNNLGYHPAPATTSLSQNLGRSWDDIPNLDWFVKVRCHSSSSRMTIVGQASLQSGLPGTP